MGGNAPQTKLLFVDALKLLASETEVTALAGLFRSTPVSSIDQPDYVNSALTLKTRLPAEDLLGLLKGIEFRLGRRRGQRWGPRPVDLDLLLLGQQRMASTALTLPHPELLKRRFVLAPLCEIAADWIIPRRCSPRLTVSEALSGLPSDSPATALRPTPWPDSLSGLLGSQPQLRFRNQSGL